MDARREATAAASVAPVFANPGAAAVDQQVVPEVRIVLPPGGLLARRHVSRADVVKQTRCQIAERDGLRRHARPPRARDVDVSRIGQSRSSRAHQ